MAPSRHSNLGKDEMAARSLYMRMAAAARRGEGL